MDDISYKKILPDPPTFKGTKKNKIEVPKYYGFDHPCTKWLLACIVSNHALDRLIKSSSNYNEILKRLHQIPDRPNLILKVSNQITEESAYNIQAILYLRPFSLAIYTKYEDALVKLTNLNDKDGNPIINPNEINYVHNFWRKGETSYFSDLITTYPAILAIRRNYLIAFKYLMKIGYNPNAKFTIVYRKPHRELILTFKDILDFVIDHLKTHPAFNTNLLMHILLNSANGLNIIDIFCFDLVNDNLKQITKNNNVVLKRVDKKPISIFQRIVQNALEFDNISDENGMQILNILRKIQEAGYFAGLPTIKLCDTNGKSMLLNELIDINNKTKKIYFKDLQNLSVIELKKLLINDYKYCISFLMKWLQDKTFKRKTNHSLHLLNLLVHVLFDTNFIELLFRDNISSDSDLLRELSEFPFMKDYLIESTVYNIRLHAIVMFRDNEQLGASFFSRYKLKSTDLLYVDKDQMKWSDGQKGRLHDEEVEYNFRKHYLKSLENKFVNGNQNYSNKYYSDMKLYLDESLQTDDLLAPKSVMVKSKMMCIYEEEHEYYNINELYGQETELECPDFDSDKDNCDNVDTIEVELEESKPNDSHCTITQVSMSSLNNDIKYYCTNNANVSQIEASEVKESQTMHLNHSNLLKFSLFNTKSKPPPLLQRRRNIIRK